MEIYKIKDLSFAYPNRENKAIENISLKIEQGEFICLCGKSGCGKTTLLRLLKPYIAPSGETNGEIEFQGKPLSDLDRRTQAAKIGFVFQNIDGQIVCDKVWHELAFGLESLGIANGEIRTKVAEISSFFGINNWFHKKTSELSGGQKQLLNLASVMVMQPDVLILDEPTSQLDPIAASEFLRTLERINQEIGTTIIISEHRLEEVFPASDRVIVMDNGKVIVDDIPFNVGKILKEQSCEMQYALPTPIRVHNGIKNDMQCPLNIREGRLWLEKLAENNAINPELIPINNTVLSDENVIELKDVRFKYEKDLPDVLSGLDLQIKKGEILAVLGGNGSGKTTLLSVISGLNAPYSGRVLINGEKISELKNLYSDILGVLPQNPQSLFVKKTVYLDLLEMLEGIPKERSDEKIKEAAVLCNIENVLDMHPYDLSGGEQQRAALAKVLLKEPEILLLDEPTKGFDAHFKLVFGNILKSLKAEGTTVIIVSHDVEFCAEYADRCAMMFDGGITSVAESREFFAGNSFYTTSANRMARNILPTAVLAEDIILACGGNADKTKIIKKKEIKLPEIQQENSVPKKHSASHIVFGRIFALLFIFMMTLQLVSKDIIMNSVAMQLSSIAVAVACLVCFSGEKKAEIKIAETQRKRKFNKLSFFAMLFSLIAVPITVFIGMYFLKDRNYYLISLLIILEILVSFCFAFEKRRPGAREMVVISVMCAIVVAGRMAFYMIPQFKPVMALVIISGICLGGEAGFLIGAITAFVSNIFFGQGPWTPWQMFVFGLIGFISGVVFRARLIPKNRISLCIYGFLSTLVIYGGIMNFSSAVMMNMELKAAYIMGFPLDLIHSASTAFFLWFISEPMLEILGRIKTKYGIMK